MIRHHARKRAPGGTFRTLALAGALAACALLSTGCGGGDELPRVRQGDRDSPTSLRILLPGLGEESLRTQVRQRETWLRLEQEMLALAHPERYPQPILSPALRSLAQRAAEDLLDPIEGLEPVFGAARGDDDRTVALVVVEVLPDTTIRRLHGSDAFTESFHDLDRRFIRRAVIRLPSWLLERPADDFANFFAHELGHALGFEGHIDEMWNHPEDTTWFWDRLMTVPIRPGQPWQAVTSEDVFAIAEGRYRLREGWIDGRTASFPEAAPHRRVPAHP